MPLLQEAKTHAGLKLLEGLFPCVLMRMGIVCACEYPCTVVDQVVRPRPQLEIMSCSRA